WADSSLDFPPGVLYPVRAGDFDSLQRAGNCLQMAAGQMQVESGIADLGMAEQYLDGAQVGAGFQHMCREAVSKQMWRNALVDAGALASLVHGLPHDLRSNGHICPPVVHRAWEQVGLGLHPAPILTQGVQQLGTQENIAVAAALALVDPNDHAFAVDMGDLEMAQFRAADAGRVQRHHHGAAHQVLCRIDHPLDLFWTEDDGELPGTLGKWDVLGEIRASQRLDVEETQSCGAARNRPCLELAFSKQIGLILPDMIRSQPIWRAVKVPGEVLYRVQVGVDRVL